VANFAEAEELSDDDNGGGGEGGDAGVEGSLAGEHEHEHEHEHQGQVGSLDLPPTALPPQTPPQAGLSASEEFTTAEKPPPQGFPSRGERVLSLTKRFGSSSGYERPEAVDEDEDSPLSSPNRSTTSTPIAGNESPSRLLPMCLHPCCAAVCVCLPCADPACCSRRRRQRWVGGARGGQRDARVQHAEQERGGGYDRWDYHRSRRAGRRLDGAKDGHERYQIA